MGCKKSKIARASENPDNTDPSNCTPAEKQQRIEARYGSDAASHAASTRPREAHCAMERSSAAAWDAGWTPFISERNSRPDAYPQAEWDERRRGPAQLAVECHVYVTVCTHHNPIDFDDYRRHRIPRGTRCPRDAGVVEFDICEWIGGPHIPPAPDVFW